MAKKNAATGYIARTKIEYPDYAHPDADGNPTTRIVLPGERLPDDFPTEATTGTATPDRRAGRDKPDLAPHDALADLLKYGSIEKAS